MKFLLRALIITTCFFACSCSQYIHVMVSGRPDTIIKDPEGKVVGTIGNNGCVKINLPREHYYAFLLSNDSVQGIDIPFALEFEKNVNKRTIDIIGACLVFPAIFFPITTHLFYDDVYYCYDYIPVQTNEDMDVK